MPLGEAEKKAYIESGEPLIRTACAVWSCNGKIMLKV